MLPLPQVWQAARGLGGRHLLNAVYGSEPIVLMYHRFCAEPQLGYVDARTFERQLAHLARHCNVISVSDLDRGLRERQVWRHGTVAITIDDGYRDTFDVAMPLLKRYGMPATVFVTTDFIDGRFWYWQDQIRYLLAAMRQDKTALRIGSRTLSLDLTTESGRWQAWSDIADACYASGHTERVSIIDALSLESGSAVPQRPPAGYEPLSWVQLRDMQQHSIDVGSHGVRHELLTHLSAEQLESELVGSKETIEAHLQTAVGAFAYPFGGEDSQDETVRAAAREAGYQTAFVAFFDTRLLNDRMAIRRFGVGADMWDFVKAADGLKRARCLQRAGHPSVHAGSLSDRGE